jgi:imidazolonepropionase
MLIENVNIATPANKEFVRGSELDKLEILKHQDVTIINGKIESISPSDETREEGRWIIPAFSDPHTHLIFCGTREDEIDLKKKFGYEGLLKRGGGIYRTVEATSRCNEETLYQESRERINRMMNNGTAVFEVKTGYGITTENEEKLLDVAERLKRDLKVKMKKTLLAHVVPKGVEEEIYIKEFKRMIEEFRKRIDYVDVFVDEGAFSPSFARKAIEFANLLGIPGRVHLNELKNLDGLATLEGLDIKSYDHMIATKEEEIDLINSVITVLPFTAITLRKDTSILSKIKKKGKIMAMGSDISPNTYVTSFPLVLSFARQLLPFTIENLINMGTLNSSYSLSLSGSNGSLHKGKDANFLVFKENYNRLGYKFGDDPIERVIINGKDVRPSLETDLRH